MLADTPHQHRTCHLESFSHTCRNILHLFQPPKLLTWHSHFPTGAPLHHSQVKRGMMPNLGGFTAQPDMRVMLSGKTIDFDCDCCGLLPGSCYGPDLDACVPLTPLGCVNALMQDLQHRQTNRACDFQGGRQTQIINVETTADGGYMYMAADMLSLLCAYVCKSLCARVSNLGDGKTSPWRASLTTQKK